MLTAIKSYLPENVKVVLRKIRYKLQDPRTLSRELLARQYLRGNGIEIGALHNPLEVGRKARVRYVDRYDNKGLAKHYPEQLSRLFVKVDIIDDGETLGSLPNGSQDFVIANHFLEHCQNPLMTLKHMHRVLKTGGILYLALPDKRYTFDLKRPVTHLEHLLKDLNEGPALSKRQHYEEWVSLVDDVKDAKRALEQTEKLIEQDYSIHFHVWTQAEILEMFIALKKQLGVHFDVEACLKNGVEFITVLRKMN